ncbi:MAG: hypothetical protein ACOCZM_02895 [Bacillota bacterium]
MLLLILIAVSVPVAAEYQLDADEIDYEYESGHIHARGNAIFETSELKVEAGELILLPDESMIRGMDGVQITTEDRSLTGDSLEFNYDQEQGSVYGARGNMDSLRFSGGEIELNRQRGDSLRAHESSLTPCILEEPHYRLEADTIYFYPEDRITGEGLSFFWGETPVLDLPGYTIHYDEEGNLRPVLPELRYDSEEGFTASLEYPYQILPVSTGTIMVEGSAHGERTLLADNRTQVTSGIEWWSEARYDREKEDDSYSREKELQSGLEGRISSSLTLKGWAEYSMEEGEDESKKKILAAGGDYSRKGWTISPLVWYDFVPGERWGEIDTEYRGDKYRLETLHKFKENSFSRQSYNLSSRWQEIDIEFDYREGYDTDYFPRLILARELDNNYRFGLEAAKIKEDDLAAKKISLDIQGEEQIQFDKFSLDLSERVHYNVYNNAKDTSGFWESSAHLKYSSEFNDRIRAGVGTGWDFTKVKGKQLFSEDEKEEESLLNLTGNLEIETEQPESAWEIGIDNSYDLLTRSWDSLGVELTRRLDCHSFSFDYDFAERQFGLGMQF